MENINEIASNTLGILLIVLVVVELFCYSTWNKRYFRHGIPVFMRTISINDTNLMHLNVKDMEARCPSSFWGPSIKFREIGQSEYAFREGTRDGVFLFFGLAYPPAIRGYLVYDPDKKQIRVTGYVILVFPVVIFGAISSVLGTGIALIFLGIFFGIPYLIESARFNAVANMAAGLISAKLAHKVNAG